jgi:hypothetical protein
MYHAEDKENAAAGGKKKKSTIGAGRSGVAVR